MWWWWWSSLVALCGLDSVLLPSPPTAATFLCYLDGGHTIINLIQLAYHPLSSAIANQIIEIYFLFSNICIYILRSSANLHYWALLRMLLVRFILVDRLAPISSSRSRSLSLDPSSFPPLSFPAMNIISPCLLPLIEFIYYPYGRLNLLSFPVPPIITNFRFCFPRCTRTPK